MNILKNVIDCSKELYLYTGPYLPDNTLGLVLNEVKAIPSPLSEDMTNAANIKNSILIRTLIVTKIIGVSMVFYREYQNDYSFINIDSWYIRVD